MLVKILDSIRCSRCLSKLSLEPIIMDDKDCIEGLLYCKCRSYPIVDGIALLIYDIIDYFTTRTKILGELIINSSNTLQSYLRDIAKKIDKHKISIDRYESNGNAFNLYNRLDDNFYNYVSNIIVENLKGGYLEIGSGIGNIVNNVSNYTEIALGIDRSFSMVKIARKKRYINAEFIVADIDLISFTGFNTLAIINTLDLLDPLYFIRSIKRSMNSNDILIIIDPYDFRDKNGDPIRLYNSYNIRSILESNGFIIDTLDHSYIPWILKVNERVYILYFSDLIIARSI